MSALTRSLDAIAVPSSPNSPELNEERNKASAVAREPADDVAYPPEAPGSTSNPPAASASAPSPRAAAQPAPARTAPPSARSYPFAFASQASTGRDGDAPVCDGTSVDDKYGSSCFGSRGLMNAQMYSAKTAAQR